ncbi:hypothetical protein GCM10010873_32810 [Cypionkella aquatica]|uniref:UDP-N-acetylmuramate--alanine ligase n=2 Tax=Cypionkella aquatica TaxID=1756042 RepID=A0AA37X223_9RHOB|nr:hypothetical protein GCM10010873_32810 [Cypionkella aquatica]
MGCVWVIAATITAMLPMKRQMVPGMTLIVLAPVLLIWIGLAHGLLWVGLGLLAFLSMFRRPLIYFARRGLGLPVELPVDLQK